jgi:gp58-like protein.
MKVSCQHESTELKGVYCEYIDLVGATPKQMFDKIMSSTMHPVDTGYNWAGTDVESTKKRHLITESEQSVYQNLVAMAEIFNGWLEFWTDESGKRWIYLRTKAVDSKKWIKKGLDMKSLNISYTSEEIFTRLYPLGDSDKVTGEPLNIMGVNPTKKSYIENYSYYLAKGIPTSVIDKEPKYQQLKTMTASDYTDAKDLYEYALEELEKCCYPTLDATLTMEDLSVYVDSLDEPPKIGYDIKCVDKEIDFILGCRIVGIERNYDDPLQTTVTISNLVRYDTFFQKLEHSSDTTDKITDSDKDGTYIPADKVKDGDHINIAYTLGNHTTQITENASEIKLMAKDVAGNKAELTVQAGKIQTLVQDVAGNKSQITQNANKIATLVKDVAGNKSQITQNANKIQTLVQDVDGNRSKITQLANQISSKVDEDDFGSLIQQNARSVRISWNKISKYAQIDDSDGLILGNESTGSYSKVGYDGRLECYIDGAEHPYHCLSYGFVSIS